MYLEWVLNIIILRDQICKNPCACFPDFPVYVDSDEPAISLYLGLPRYLLPNILIYPAHLSSAPYALDMPVDNENYILGPLREVKQRQS